MEPFVLKSLSITTSRDLLEWLQTTDQMEGLHQIEGVVFDDYLVHLDAERSKKAGLKHKGRALPLGEYKYLLLELVPAENDLIPVWSYRLTLTNDEATERAAYRRWEESLEDEEESEDWLACDCCGETFAARKMYGYLCFGCSQVEEH